jgi:hypothetical protein
MGKVQVECIIGQLDDPERTNEQRDSEDRVPKAAIFIGRPP